MTTPSGYTNAQIFFCITLWCWHSLALAGSLEPYQALVIAVHDGDSLAVNAEATRVAIRVADIDAPELKQPGGAESKTSLAEACLGVAAKIYPATTDRYGRTVARVTCNGIDAASHQVSRGMAWVFSQYARQDSPLYPLQDAARQSNLGIWAAPNPVPPWVWRQSKPQSE